MVRMRGQVARRTVRHYGMSYDVESGQIAAGDPIPDWLSELRRRCAEMLGVPDERLAECLLTRYPAGATIGWHRDAPMFGDVVGVSLRSACLLRFQRGRGDQRRVFEQVLEPRSAYALTGASLEADDPGICCADRGGVLVDAGEDRGHPGRRGNGTGIRPPTSAVGVGAVGDPDDPHRNLVVDGHTTRYRPGGPTSSPRAGTASACRRGRGRRRVSVDEVDDGRCYRMREVVFDRSVGASGRAYAATILCPRGDTLHTHTAEPIRSRAVAGAAADVRTVPGRERSSRSGLTSAPRSHPLRAGGRLRRQRRCPAGRRTAAAGSAASARTR
ncbi:MAG: Oxidoreductase, 2OG-Fe(II) oxygenase family [Frankiales bacterium]|nr:Oxidoreductase, 2OG-Fe(II) oxygenase family [Frankiales bacterium]